MPRAMKDSGIKWIGVIPADWDCCKLKYLISSLNSGTSITATDLTEKGYPVYGGGQQIGFFSQFNMEDTLIIGRVGSCGCVTKILGKAWATDNALIVTTDFPINYLYYILVAAELNKLSTSNAQPLITSGKVLNHKVAVCWNKNEQQRIAAFLNDKCARIDSIVEKTRASIVEYKKLKQAIITRAVTKGMRPARPMKDSGVEWLGDIPESYNVRKIKHLGSYRNGLTYTPNDVVDEGQGTLILRSSNVQQGKLCFDNNVYVGAKIPDRLLVQKGDIIICSRNGSRELIGKCAIIENDMTASFGAFMMILRCDSPKYMYYILNSDVFKYYLSTFLTSTINQLTGENFGNMKIVWCDDKTEQKEIAQYLDKKTAAIDSLIEKKGRLVTELERLKKSLIFEYVTGKKEAPT